MSARPILATEDAYTSTLMDAAQLCGWFTFHVRPAMKANGAYRTAVSGDGVGFPDLVLVHPEAHELWFVEVKRDDAPRILPPAQAMWQVVLTRAGYKHQVWRVPSELDAHIRDLRDVARTKVEAQR